jgi:hypothetical protein
VRPAAFPNSSWESIRAEPTSPKTYDQGMDIAELIERLRNDDVRALARAISPLRFTLSKRQSYDIRRSFFPKRLTFAS